MIITSTERLNLEEASLSDHQFIFELLNSPNWLKYIGDRGIKDQSDAELYIINSLLKSYQTNNFGLYKMVLKDSNIPIGVCGLLKRDYLDHPDIGFAIFPNYEGKGYTYEAARGILKVSKTKLGIKEILAITSPDNNGSQHLLVKLGFNKVKTIQSSKDEELILFSSQLL